MIKTKPVSLQPQGYMVVMGTDESGSYGASVVIGPGESAADALKRLWAQVPGFDANGEPIGETSA